MSKLAAIIIASMIILGITIFIFNDENGIKNEVLDGHERIKDNVRQFNYSTD